MSAPQLDRSLPDLLRLHLSDAIEEIEAEVRKHVPDYARALHSEYGAAVRQTISETVACFVNSLTPGTARTSGTSAARSATAVTTRAGTTKTADPANWTELAELYSRLGALEARQGHSLEVLQTALRLSSQVACRRFIQDAYRLGWTRETLSVLTDTLFALLARAADAGAQGFAREQGHIASDRERQRAKLRDLLIREPAPDPETIADRAKAAEWPVPGAVAVFALPAGSHPPSRILPPDVLRGGDPHAPYLIVPDPDSPGWERLSSLLTTVGPAAIGPTVPVTGVASSLRWALHTITLIERGILPAGRPVRATDHTALLAAAMAEDLIHATSPTLLAPLLALPPHRRLPLLTTLLAYLECDANAVTTAARLTVHEQTVRYRLRRIAELTGQPLNDPDRKLDLMTTLNWLVHAPSDDRRPARVRS